MLLKHLPLWTAIMKPIFTIGENVATSSCVEAEFAILKCRIFDGQLPMRADKFVLQHVKYLRGETILLSGKNDCGESKHSSSQDNEAKSIPDNRTSIQDNREGK